MKKLRIALLCTLFTSCIPAMTLAGSPSTPIINPYYVAVDAGLFQGSYNLQYNDQTDLIAQNIAETVLQQGYTAGIALGYNKVVSNQYLMGFQLAGHINSADAYYASGASTAAFNDTIKIKNTLDLALVPGILLSDTIAAYLKLGVSMAYVTDQLTSPTGFTPTIVNYNNNKNVFGFSAGLGIKKYISNKISIFTEYNYRDYGRVNFSNFENFTATYNHSAHIYAQSVTAGAAYNFS